MPNPICPLCGGTKILMGKLNTTRCYRCRNCGNWSTKSSTKPERTK